LYQPVAQKVDQRRGQHRLAIPSVPIETSIGRISDVLLRAPSVGIGTVRLIDAAKNSFPVTPIVVSTDPPYYDNIGYADLSDFFMYG
jgi:adenine-specific DNA methylase